MKCVYYFSLLLVFFIFSCNNTDKVIETAWNDFENEQYVSAMEKFSGIAKKYKNDWNKGYSLECQVLRYLYFTEKISQEQFLIEIKVVYDLWYAHNPSEKKHLIPYGCTVYLLGDEKQCLAIMKQVYNENWKYNFENPSADDIHNFFAGITTGAINKEDYQNTVYEFLFDLTDKEIINIFVGN